MKTQGMNCPELRGLIWPVLVLVDAPLTTKQLQQAVKLSGLLSEADWEPAWPERGPYPKWVHRLQAVLQQLKKEGAVEHDAEQQSYQAKNKDDDEP